MSKNLHTMVTEDTKMNMVGDVYDIKEYEQTEEQLRDVQNMLYQMIMSGSSKDVGKLANSYTKVVAQKVAHKRDVILEREINELRSELSDLVFLLETKE